MLAEPATVRDRTGTRRPETTDRIIPAAVGVDVGCGMIAVRPRSRSTRCAAAPLASSPGRWARRRTWCGTRVTRIDEIPDAYKEIDVVMQDAADLVEIRHTLHRLVNVKGD